MPTQAVRHTCSGNLRIHNVVKILRYIRSDMYDVHLWREDGPPPLANGALCLSTMVNPVTND